MAKPEASRPYMPGYGIADAKGGHVRNFPKSTKINTLGIWKASESRFIA